MSMPHGTSVTPDSKDSLYEARNRQSKVDWTVGAINGAHLWVDTESSGCHPQLDCKVMKSLRFCVLLEPRTLVGEGPVR